MADGILYAKNTDEFKDAIAKYNTVIVDFYADWCPPCRKLGETIHNLLPKDYKNAIVLKLNCDEAGVAEVSKEHKVSGIPHVVLYVEGK